MGAFYSDPEIAGLNSMPSYGNVEGPTDPISEYDNLFGQFAVVVPDVPSYVNAPPVTTIGVQGGGVPNSQAGGGFGDVLQALGILNGAPGPTPGGANSINGVANPIDLGTTLGITSYASAGAPKPFPWLILVAAGLGLYAFSKHERRKRA